MARKKPQAKEEVEQVQPEAEPIEEQPVEETKTEEPQAEEEVEQVHFPAFIEDKPMVKLSDLQASRVVVGDERGNFFYLDPAMRSGEYILRVVPKDPQDASGA